MIEIRNLMFGYGGKPILNNLNACFETGSVHVILGESGCGKTTLLRLICGLEQPNSGAILINGKIVSDAGPNRVPPGLPVPPHRRDTAMVFQDPALWPHMTVLENLLFCSPLSRGEAERKAYALLEKAGIRSLADRKPHRLSGGEARRTALLRAIMSGRSHLLMDEPLVNLDPELKNRLLAWIGALQAEEKRTLVYVTHDREEARMLAGKPFRLAGGVLAPVKEDPDPCER